jgi:8-oxo-dGTP diphosphatase
MDNEKILKVSAAIIIDSKKRFLLQKKDSGYPLGPNKWSLVGGAVEKGENTKETIQREIKEEIGINFDKDKINPFGELLFEGNLNGRFLRVNHYMFIVNFDKRISDIKIGEGAGFAFFEKEELKKINLMPPTKEMLERFFKENDTSM